MLFKSNNILLIKKVTFQTRQLSDATAQPLAGGNTGQRLGRGWCPHKSLSTATISIAP